MSFKITRHAQDRLYQRFDEVSPNPEFSIKAPDLPTGVGYPIEVEHIDLRMSSVALWVCDKHVVLTVVPCPVEVLASVLVRLLFGIWEVDREDGFFFHNPELPKAEEERLRRFARKSRQKRRNRDRKPFKWVR